MKLLLYILTISLFIVSCEKAKDCLTGKGEQIIIESSLAEFDTLFVNDYFTVYLIQDTINFIQISGYEAFVNTTKFEIKENSLFLTNEHKCKFSKPENNGTDIFLHVNQISRIRLNGSSKVISETGLVNDDEIGLIINSKYNEADLKLNCKTFYYWNTHINGGKIYLHGDVENLKLWNVSLASVDARNLESNNVFIITDSKADCYINASYKIDCTIKGQGNVYYSGMPDFIIVNDTVSAGRLIYSLDK